MRVVGGETFVQPDVAPILAGDQVAEPLMGQLVSDQPLAAADVFGVSGEERVIGQGGDAGVFHAARHEIVDAHLRVFGPRIRHADFLLEKSHHIFGALKGVGRFVDLGGRRVKRERNVFMLVLDLLEITGQQRHQIRDMRFVLPPAHRHQASVSVFLFRNEFAVGQHRHAFRHAAGDLGGELFIRRIEARIPMPRLNGFALRKKMRVALFVAHFRRAEIKPLLWLGLIGNGDTGFLVRRNGLGKSDHDFFVGHLLGLDLLGGGDGLNIQIDRVEPEFLKGLGNRFEGESGLCRRPCAS